MFNWASEYKDLPKEEKIEILKVMIGDEWPRRSLKEVHDFLVEICEDLRDEIKVNNSLNFNSLV